METLRDLGLFGMFLAMNFAWGTLLSAGFGFAGTVFASVMFPIALLHLSFRRAFALTLVIEGAELLWIALGLSFFNFLANGLFTLSFLPFSALGIRVFKNLQRRIPLALLGFYVVGSLAPTVLYCSMAGVIVAYRPDLVMSLLNVFGIAQVLSSLGSVKGPSLNINPNDATVIIAGRLVVGAVSLYLLYLIASPLIIFIAQCWLMKKVKKRTANLPMGFPT